MERYVPFEPGEFYHIYNRGVDKRKIFFSKGDWIHFQRLLYICNSVGNNIRPSRIKSRPLPTLVKGEPLVDVCAYTLMDNHFHLLVYEKSERGITKFMRKLLTAYSMYMNKKYERTGPLMCRPFRAKHIDSDRYLRWVVSYIHMNIADKVEPDWKDLGITNKQKVFNYMKDYQYSSFKDYMQVEREESLILNTKILASAGVENFGSLNDMLRMVKEAP